MRTFSNIAYHFIFYSNIIDIFINPLELISGIQLLASWTDLKGLKNIPDKILKL